MSSYKMRKIFWIAAESSADLHTFGVINNLKEYENYGIGGTQMQKAGFRSIFPFERFAVTGLIEIFKHLIFFLRVKKKIINIFETTPPDLVVLVDYPGLNLRIAREAKLRGIPVLYFISPKFWAWNYKRIFKIKKYTDMIASILPFEEQYFKKYGIIYEYVGNPIAEEISFSITKKDFVNKYKLNKEKQIIGFFPGSRNNEISRLLPEFIKTVNLIPNKKFEFLISRSPAVDPDLFSSLIPQDMNIKIVEKMNYELMKYSDFLIIASGTASLEAAIIGTPHIIVYKVNPLSFEIGKHLIKINWLGLPNIIMNKTVVPELIQKDCNAENIIKHLQKFIDDKNKISSMK